MALVEKERDDLLAAGDAVCSTTVLLPSAFRDELERAAREHERTLGGEVRVALRAHLAGELKLAA